MADQGEIRAQQIPLNPDLIQAGETTQAVQGHAVNVLARGVRAARRYELRITHGDQKTADGAIRARQALHEAGRLRAEVRSKGRGKAEESESKRIEGSDASDQHCAPYGDGHCPTTERRAAFAFPERATAEHE